MQNSDVPLSPMAAAAISSLKPESKLNAEAMLAWCAHEVRGRERAYVRAVQGGTPKSIRNARWRYLRSTGVLIDAARRANDKLPRERQVTKTDLFIVARMIRWGKPLPEPAVLWWKKKSSGGHRPIFDFGIVRRAACEVLRSILKAHYHPRPFQCDGAHLAVRKIKQLIKQGYEVVALQDISNHFGSINDEQLPKLLPLARGVIDHVVSAKNVHVVPQGRGSIAVTPALIEEARRGIPQGSPIASLVTQIVTSQLTWKDGPQTVMVNYADNFCVLSKSLHEGNNATDALGVAIATLPGGKFHTKKEKSVHISAGFNFLGHHFRLVDSKLVVSPTYKNEKAFEARLKKYDDEINELLHNGSAVVPSRKKLKAFCLVGDMWIFARSWAGAFRECNDIDATVDAVRIVVAEHLEFMNVSWSELDDYENPSAEWDGDLYDG